MTESIKFSITFGNAACQYPTDLPGILRKMADQFENGREPERIIDGNGNKVGNIEYIEAEAEADVKDIEADDIDDRLPGRWDARLKR